MRLGQPFALLEGVAGDGGRARGGEDDGEREEGAEVVAGVPGGPVRGTDCWGGRLGVCVVHFGRCVWLVRDVVGVCI